MELLHSITLYMDFIKAKALNYSHWAEGNHIMFLIGGSIEFLDMQSQY